MAQMSFKMEAEGDADFLFDMSQMSLRMKTEEDTDIKVHSSLLPHLIDEDKDEEGASLLTKSEELNDVVQALKDFCAENLIKIFREIARFSEFSLHYHCNFTTDQELILQLMLISPLMEDMQLTAITAVIASQEHIFMNRNAYDLAAILDKCNAFPKELVNEALTILQQLNDSGIMFTPKIVLNTFRAYKKNTLNFEAADYKLTDDQIRNSIVFKRIIKYMSKIIKEKLYTAISCCLEKSVYKERYLVHEISIYKAMLLGLISGLMRHDTVLSSLLIIIVSFNKNYLDLQSFISWLKNTQCIVADDMLAAGNFLLSLKSSNLFEIPLEGEEIILHIMNAFNVPTDFISSQPAKRCQTAFITLPISPGIPYTPLPQNKPSTSSGPSTSSAMTSSATESEPQACSGGLSSNAQSGHIVNDILDQVLESLKGEGITLTYEEMIEVYNEVVETLNAENLTEIHPKEEIV